jgi:leucyl aminopeptidase
VADSFPALLTSEQTAAETDADVLVVATRPAASGDGVEVLTEGTALPGPVADALTPALHALGVAGSADETTRLLSPPGVRARTVLAVGIGRRNPEDPETLRRAAGAAARALGGAGSAVLALPHTTGEQVGAAAEGALMGAYSFTAFRSTPGTAKPPLGTVIVPASGDGGPWLDRARVVTAAVRRARDWINTPPADLTPEVFADQITAAAAAVGVEVEVLDEVALAHAGYGGIIGVGRGSANPPRLVRLAYRATQAPRHLAVVGKGITFDSGGLSLKPAEGMIGMKTDMSGAAAAVAAVLAAAELQLPIAMTVYAALAENMPSGTASRPQDVLRMYGGRTVEVLNTDAEGRLVMADALARASEDSPDLLVDIATLTGACTVALGNRVAGLITDDADAAEQVRAAADAAGEQVWALPIPEEMRAKLDSAVADLANVGNRFGGALQAAAFLREFVPSDVPWAHLDIAGPARNPDTAYGYTPKGGTGFGVRTLVALAERLA